MINTAQISTLQTDNTITVIGGGTLDLTNCTEFSKLLKQASMTNQSVEVDLRTADFIDTQIVQDLARSAIALLKKDKKLRLLVSNDKCPLRVIQISGFEKIMDVVVE